MKIALVCPSNLLYMPYVRNYEKILNEEKIKYEIIKWDRFNDIDKKMSLVYRDSKTGHKRNLYDYFKYKRFIEKIIKNKNYDKIIVFGIPLAFMLRRLLQGKYRNRYIIDIRDHHKILNYFKIDKVIENSLLTVLSSPAFKSWLPLSNKYVINHNTSLERIEDINTKGVKAKTEMLNISYIGAIRDYQINSDFIHSLKNKKNYNLLYHGEGTVNQSLTKYIHSNEIRNVVLTGRYDSNQEHELYKNSDLINILYYPNSINNRTLMPNRFYNTLIYGQPLIAFEGNYLSDIIKENNLGLVINSFEDIEEKIESFLLDIDRSTYEENRIDYLKEIIKDNKTFKNKLINYINNY